MKESNVGWKIDERIMSAIQNGDDDDICIIYVIIFAWKRVTSLKFKMKQQKPTQKKLQKYKYDEVRTKANC